MEDRSGIIVSELVERIQRELVETADAIRSHRFLVRLRARDVPWERLRALAAEEHAIVSSDRRSFAQLAARFPLGLAGEFFLGMAESEGLALGKLRGLADWLGLTDDDLRAHEPHPGAQAYPASPGSRLMARGRTSCWLFLPMWLPGVRTAGRSRPRCARHTGPATTRSPSSSFSPIRLRTSSPALWLFSVRGSPVATHPCWLAGRPDSCRHTNCLFGTRSRKDFNEWTQNEWTQRRSTRRCG